MIMMIRNRSRFAHRCQPGAVKRFGFYRGMKKNAMNLQEFDGFAKKGTLVLWDENSNREKARVRLLEIIGVCSLHQIKR
jgi:hypothetical protein